MIGSWVNVDMAVKAFRLFQQAVPDSVLFWIGPAPDLDRLTSTYGTHDIIFTGCIKEHVETYFMMLDTGILPHKKSPFQDMAFHLKLAPVASTKRFTTISVSSRAAETARDLPIQTNLSTYTVDLTESSFAVGPGNRRENEEPSRSF
jgi:hypothetical protein